MMGYEVFKETVKEKFLSCMPGKYRDMEVRVDSVEKINRRMDRIHLRGTGTGQNISPAVYVNDMYGQYLKTGDLQGTLQAAAGEMDAAFQRTAALPPLDMRTARDNIIFQLVNTAQNEDMLRGMPHREFQDLSVIYRWVADIGSGGMASAVVNDSMAENLGMGEGELFRAALENTRRLLPPVVKPIDEVLALVQRILNC